MFKIIKNNKRKFLIFAIFLTVGLTLYIKPEIALSASSNLIKVTQNVNPQNPEAPKPADKPNSKLGIIKSIIIIYACLFGMGILSSTDWDKIFKNL